MLGVVYNSGTRERERERTTAPVYLLSCPLCSFDLFVSNKTYKDIITEVVVSIETMMFTAPSQGLYLTL